MKLVATAKKEKICTREPTTGSVPIRLCKGSAPLSPPDFRLPRIAASQARNMSRGTPVPPMMAVRILPTSPCRSAQAFVGRHPCGLILGILGAREALLSHCIEPVGEVQSITEVRFAVTLFHNWTSAALNWAAQGLSKSKQQC